MSKRVIGEPCIIPINFRVSETMKKELDSAADLQNISTTEYLRRAIAEKLERESRAHPCGADGEIPAAMVEMMRAIAREEVKNAGTAVSQVNTGKGARQSVKVGK
ncbi:MAG TPA: ribbon-helix-helix protein, CopG family [Methanocorpusculum sp.]|nr:ribbon-helix-helix protein, CopG family [Methanocorpusculum sp.]